MCGLLLCTCYVVVSATMIHFNKFVMRRFPYALVLTSCHMTASFVVSGTLYMFVPSLFPAMAKVKDNARELPLYFLALGVLFGVSLFTSNQAYLYCSVAFLQFMKEANIVLIFLISCSVGLQKMNRVSALIVLWILLGSSLCVKGEIHFVMIGFIIQAISQFGECGKNVLGEYLLVKSSLKLDPLTYVLLMAPVALCFLLVGLAWSWNAAIPGAILENWHYLLPSAGLAVCLNILIALVLKECSAMGFIIAGVVKDILIVVASATVMGEMVSSQQYIGFIVALTGCAMWSSMKAAPDRKSVV